MKRTLLLGLLVAFASLMNVKALSDRIDKGYYGVCVAPDDFYQYLDGGNTHDYPGWLSDLKVGHVRVQIPLFQGTDYNNNSVVWNARWAKLANFGTNNNLKLTVLIGNGWFPDKSDAGKQAYLNALIARIQGVIGKFHYYELGNEMDFAFSDGRATVADYKDWLQRVSSAIKAVDPNAKFILTSCAGLTRNGQAYGWYADIFAADCHQFVDYYSIHTYWHNVNSNPANDDLKTLISNFNGWVGSKPRKPLMVTEGGYFLSNQAPPGATPLTQQRFNTQRVVRLWTKDIADIYPLERIDTFCVRDYPQENFGLGAIDQSQIKRPQYYGLRNVYALLNGAVFMQQRTGGFDASVKCYEFMNASREKIVVIWHSAGTVQSVNVPIGSATASLITHQNGAPSSAPFNGVNVVPVSIGLEQKYVKTGAARFWAEGESPSSSNYAWTTANLADCYGGQYLKLDATATGNRDVSYAFSNVPTGNYAVYISATPATSAAPWSSRYQYWLNRGTAYDGSAMRSSQTSGIPKGVFYGPSTGLQWTYLGDFYLGATGTQATFTLRVNSNNNAGRYLHYLDAIYLEPK